MYNEVNYNGRTSCEHLFYCCIPSEGLLGLYDAERDLLAIAKFLVELLIVILKSWFGGHSIAPFDRSYMSSYSSSVVTMVMSCIVSEIKRYIGRKSRFSHPTCI